MCENGKKELKNFFKEENYLDTVENMYCLKKDYTNIKENGKSILKMTIQYI